MNRLTKYRGTFVRGNFTRFQVAMYDPSGMFVAVVSGMGRNRGTWDSEHGRSAAYTHAAQLRKDQPGFVYRVEPVL